MKNIEFSEKYLRRPVIVPSTEEVIGEIGVPLFDRKTGRMEWILIKEPAPKKGTIMLEAKNVISVDEKEILVTPGPNMLYEYTQNIGERSLRKKTMQLIGRDAIDEGGIKIGTVSGVEIDPITLLLISVIVVNSGGAMAFDRSNFYLSSNKIVIGRRKADIWTETISYEVKEELQERRRHIENANNSRASRDKAEKIDVSDYKTNSGSQKDVTYDEAGNVVEVKKKPQIEENSLEGMRQRLNALSSRIMEVVEGGETTNENKTSISSLLGELNQVKDGLDGLSGVNGVKNLNETKLKETVRIAPELLVKDQEKEIGEDAKKTRQIKRITISSIFFPKEDADRIHALDGYFVEGDVELQYPKGYEKMQQKRAAKKEAGVVKIIFSQILGGSAFAAVYYVLTLLKMI